MKCACVVITHKSRCPRPVKYQCECGTYLCNGCANNHHAHPVSGMAPVEKESKRPCDVCRRPCWDGGHALNPRECNQSNVETCRLYAVVAAARKIANVTAGGSLIVFGDVPDEYGIELQNALNNIDYETL